MAKIKPFAFWLLCSLLLVSASIALGTDEKDPELQQCKHQCKHQQAFHESQKQECQERCERYYKEKHGGGSGGGNPQIPEEQKQEKDPMKQYRQCRKQCQRESEPGSRQQEQEEKCREKCLEQLTEQQGEKGHGNNHHEEEEDNNPFVFEDQHFTTALKTQHGKVRLLQKFSDRSKLLSGIKNYRLMILEAEPQTFIVPNHWDAEAVIFVAQGKGTISLIHSDKRETFNLKCGDILRIPAGTTVYLINSDNNEKLVIAMLLQPVSTPGHFEAFVGAGGENPESYFKAFSSELLEAAFDTRGDKMQKMFQQKKGAIMKASEEQIKAMSQHEEGGIWPFGESKGAVNLYQKHPIQSNDYGEVREVSPNDYKQLEDLDVGVSFANITKGAMETPYYNSKSTKISIVLNGEGYFEMACPHLSSSSQTGQSHEKHKGSEGQQGKSSASYQKVKARLRRGMAIIVPAGHPVIMVASKNQNLEVLCFEINVSNNQRFPLAGRKNIWNQIEREAKELAFGVPSREVDEVLRSQDQDWFFKGPRQLPQQHQGRAVE